MDAVQKAHASSKAKRHARSGGTRINKDAQHAKVLPGPGTISDVRRSTRSATRGTCAAATWASVWHTRAFR
jgi:hypothetical protein